MATGSRLTLLLAAALVASLAAHALRGGGAPAAAGPSSPRGAPAAPFAPPPPTAAAAREGDEASCEVRLDRCRGQSLRLAFEAIQARAEPRAPEGDGEPPSDDGSGPEAQARALCRKGKQALRESWQNDRDAIVDSLATTLNDPGEQARNLGKQLAEMQRVLSLGERELASLSERYAARRAELVDGAAASLDGEPPDVESVLIAAQRLFAEEDALVRDAAGDGGVARWRASQLESRTVILALLAALAGAEWDEDLVW